MPCCTMQISLFNKYIIYIYISIKWSFMPIVYAKSFNPPLYFFFLANFVQLSQLSSSSFPPSAAAADSSNAATNTGDSQGLRRFKRQDPQVCCCSGLGYHFSWVAPKRGIENISKLVKFLELFITQCDYL